MGSNPTLTVAVPHKEGAAIVLSPDFGTMRFLLLISLLLGACTASQPLPTTVFVRDSTTHTPVAQASVTSVGLNLFLPTWHDTFGLSAGSTIGPHANPEGTQATTDAQGSAMLSLAGNRPNQVYVSAKGYQPLRLVVRTSANAIQQPKGWARASHTPSSPDEANAPTLEARFVVPH